MVRLRFMPSLMLWRPVILTLCTAGVAGVESEWPSCYEQDVAIRNAGQGLFANLQGFGATSGCFKDDCWHTDKFTASAIESCPKVCISLPRCEFWVWGKEGDENKCWFRTGDAGREAAEGWISGSRACKPPDAQALVRGNDVCWVQGFDYNACCDLNYGPGGNQECWSMGYTYDWCCFPRFDLEAALL
eukprot:gnl/TRDRNA2_/TRDRNA2_193076_c0_seq1.p1 gnl/TRDRNA2_/TRDRNA2_193076_c0~~gnl/TRDRNA2_/TRDRNA2_193076_c0_seq1.p1  ORF type:complete len:188 (+),score=31.22 gnl/TRDRNA2_/TRDRNA2_193076_c0_seq1:52-615(+)